MNFKQYSIAVHKHIKYATFKEVDAHYKLKTDPQKAAKAIKQTRKNNKPTKINTNDNLDFDYSMNY